MARTTDADVEPIGLWTPLEAEQLELKAYMDTRLGLQDAEPEEPAWVAEALAASWPRALAEAAAARC
ncbi:MAG: hypothetical protein ACTS8Z_06525 [Candidatus Limnocylindrales bacterium]